MKREKHFKERERLALKNIISEKTGYNIRSNALLIQAFTRSSYSAEQGGENNEILEFIGDQVLSYYVVKLIAERYGALNSDCEYTFRVRENRFNAIKQELVNNETLAKIIDEWDIAKYLIVGKSDYANEVDKQVKVKADLFEAIIGAIAVASEWNGEVLEKAIKTSLILDERINEITEIEYRTVNFDIESSINALKELAEHGGCTPPRYEMFEYDGDEKTKYACRCVITNDKTGIIRLVRASSKKAAKKAASYLVLCDHFDLQNKYGVNKKTLCWVYHQDGKLMPEQFTKE